MLNRPLAWPLVQITVLLWPAVSWTICLVYIPKGTTKNSLGQIFLSCFFSNQKKNVIHHGHHPLRNGECASFTLHLHLHLAISCPLFAFAFPSLLYVCKIYIGCVLLDRSIFISSFHDEIFFWYHIPLAICINKMVDNLMVANLDSCHYVAQRASEVLLCFFSCVYSPDLSRSHMRRMRRCSWSGIVHTV